MKKFLSVIVLLVAFLNTLHAQEGCDIATGTCEVCDNGVDDDGDTLVDALDPKCAAFYGLEFVGDATDCSVDPPTGTSFWTFNNTQPVESANNTVDTQSKMAIGDIDNDGIPDVVASSKFNQQIRVIATTDGQADGSSSGDVKSDFKLSGGGSPIGGGGRNAYFDLELFTADIDRDGIAEIFSIAFEIDNSSKAIVEYYLLAFSYAPASLSLNWYVSLGSIRPGIPAIADFDGDGLAEVYLKNRIYAAESGALLADAGGDWLNTINAAPVAVNANTASTNLELVCGNLIYNVPNLSSRSLQSLSIWKDMNSTASAADKYYPKTFIDVSEYGLTSFSSTSVADFDKDGDIDVFMTGATLSNNGQTAVWWWDPVGGGISIFEAAHPDVVSSGKGKPTTQTFPLGWTWGAGRINLGDIDGDGQLEATFVSGNQLFALENSGGTLGPAWATPRTINDSKSGIITTTVYDFENDGEPELVYRDAYELRIIDGTTGQDKPGVPAIECKSHTMSEGPIIADVNGDGATDICVPCYQATGAFDPADGYSAQQRGSIHLYFSSNNSWLPTRKVWNQPGYFVVNISDDLTVPNPQLNQNINFGTAPCSNGVPAPNMPLNLFLNQVPNFSANGCPVYPGPDISFVGDDPTLQPGDPGYVDPSDPNYFPAVEVIPPTCGDLEIIVNFNIINDGLRAISSDIPTSFWDGDPSVDASANLLHTEVLPVTNFGIGDTLSYNGVAFNSTGKAFTLYVVLNDDGTTAPPFAITGQIEECKLGNNIYDFPIVPEPFTVQIEIIQDNLKCEDAAPDNGELRAVVFENGLEAADYSKYGFQWYDGADPTAPVVPNPKGQLDRLTGMEEGDYTVIVTNLDKGCESLPIDTTIVRIGVDPVITIVENSPQSQCSPFNGELEVFIDGGNAGYTFEWFKGAGFTPMGVTSSVISNLQQDEYFVRVNRDGCSKIASLSLSGPIIPDGQATVASNVTDCSTPNSGSVDAEAVIAGVIQDPALYDFIWYHWDPNTNTLASQISSTYGTGKSRSGMPVGWYAVIVSDISTNCQSFPPSPVEIMDNTQVPSITLNELVPNTSCDPNNPNGQLQVNILLGGVPQDPAIFTVSWFEGDNTLLANQISTTSGVNGEIVTGVGSPGIPYTALVSSALNCAVSDTLSVSQNSISPVLAGTSISNSICDPSLVTGGGTPFTGAVLTTVTFNGILVSAADLTNFYSFEWYDGSDVTSDPIIAGETSAALNNVDAGFYSVIVNLDSVSCTSTPITVEVTNISVLPTVTIIEDSPQTSCDNKNPTGQLTAVGLTNGAPSPDGYTFQWYKGKQSGSHLFDGNHEFEVGKDGNIIGVDGETITNLDNKDFTVLITDNTTGCQQSAIYKVSETKIKPTVTLTKTDNTSCVPSQFNGTITAVVTDPNGSHDYANDYTFNWLDDKKNPVVDADPSTPLTLDGIEGNKYTLELINDITNCESHKEKIELYDVPAAIDIIITENFPSTNCSGAPNGILAAAVDVSGLPVTAGYTFEWFTGSDPSTGTPTNTDGNDYRAIDLQGGASNNYVVKVTEDASGCEEIFIALINDASELPVVTITPASNAGCEAGKYTGSVTANITYQGIPVVGAALGNYSFNWTGPGAAADQDPLTPEILDGIVDGTYTLDVTNTLLGCTSLLANATVTYVPTVITIATTNTPSTNCLPTGPPNGSILADVWVDLDGNGIRNVGVEDDPVLFDFRWATGTDMTTPIAGETNLNISDLQGGVLVTYNYTVEAKHLASGCTQTFTTLLDDASELPVVTLTPASNAGCIAGLYTGSVTANITYQGVPVLGAALADYTFAWTGPGTDQNLATPEVLDDIVDGAYTLTVTNTTVGCTSLIANTNVTYVPNVITIASVNTPSTNCLPGGAPNGAIASTSWVDLNGNSILDVGEDNPALFTYEWFTGTDTSTPIAPAETNATVSAIQGGVASNYTLEVTHLGSGCTQTFTTLLDDASELPVVTLTPASNAGCIAGLYTGSVTANITYQGVPVLGAALADYTFAWTGPGTDQNLATPEVLDDIVDGAYTLTVTNTTVGCTSLIANTNVTYVPNVITIASVNTPSTNCLPGGAPNGAIASTSWVDLNGNSILDVGEDNPALFTYEWFTGTDTSTPIAPAETNATVSAIQGGVASNYTLEVTHLGSGCTQTFTTLLDDASELPVVTLTPASNAGCIAGLYTGSVTANITYQGVPVLGAALADYTFAWTGPGTDQNLATPEVLDDIVDGAYTLTVTNTTVGCTSLIANTNVTYVPNVITIASVNTPSTNCLPGGAPNGAIASTSWVDLNGNSILDVGEDNPALFTYEWFTGTDTSTPIAPAETNATVSAIQGGVASNYTLEVTHLGSGCTQTFTTLLDDASELPVVTLTPASNAGCIAGLYTGSVTANITYQGVPVLGAALADYTFAWTGPGTDQNLATPEVLDDIVDGAYTLTVTNTTVGCTSLIANTNVTYVPNVITIASVNTPSTNCLPGGAPNGAIASTSWVDLNGNSILDVGEDNPALFTYEWFTGTDTSTPIAPAETNATVSAIQGGVASNYTLEVTHLGSGCTQTFTTLLDDASELPVVTLTPASNAGCIAGLYTGSVTANITYQGVPVLGAALADYTFAWTGPGTDQNLATPEVLDDIVDGAYTLTVTNTTVGCTSLIANTNVTYVPNVITIASVNTPSTNCLPGGAPNGAIASTSWVDLNGNSILDVGEDNPALFTYEWFTGTDTSTPIAPAETNATVSAIQGGVASNYTLEVTHLGSGCTQTFTTLLDDASELPVVTLTPASNAGCIAGLYTGSVTANITYQGVPVLGAALADYTFAWTGPGTDQNLATPEVLDDIVDGAYTLTVTNTTVGCTSLIANTNVTYVPNVITIASVNTPSTNCLPGGAPNGAIASTSWVDLNGNSILDVGEDNPALFTYEWFTGTDTSTPIAPAETNATVSAIQGGVASNYTLEVTHLGSGCTQTFTTLLDDASELPVVTLTPTDNKGCTAGNYTGTVTATVLYKGIDVTASGDYSFSWTSSDLTFVSVDAPVITSLKGSETYTLSAQNTVLGCTALDATSTVDDSPDPIEIFFTNTLNSSCSATGKGSILAGIDLNSNGSPDPGEDLLANLGDYSFTWHPGNTASGLPLVPPATLVSANNINQLEGNEFYTLEVQQISTGCTATYTEFVQKVVITPNITVAAVDYIDCQTDVYFDVVINNIADFTPNDPIADFTYTWYRGVDATGAPLNQADIDVILNGTSDGARLTQIDLGSGLEELPAEDYTVVVQHNNSECNSIDETDRIDPILAPLFTITDFSITASSICNAGDGSIEATVVEAGIYSYEWYAGTPVNSPPDSYYTDPETTFSAPSIGGAALLPNIMDGNYTVVVTNSNGCKEFKTFYVPFNQGQAVGFNTVTPITDCSIPNGGVIDATISNLGGLPPGVGLNNPQDERNYIFDLYAGTNPTVGIGIIDTQVPVVSGGGVSFINLIEGNYTVIITQNFGSGCLSEPKLATIENWAYDPVIALTGSINPNTSCDLPATPDGSFTLNIQHHPDEDWEITFPEPTYSISGVAADPLKGNDFNLGAGLAIGDHAVNNLGPTDYTVTVTSSRGCTSVTTFTVPDEPETIELMDLAIADADMCNPSGSITILDANLTIIGDPVATPSVTEYDFTWYIGPDYATAILGPIIHGPLPGGADPLVDGNFLNSNTYGSMGPGTYWVLANKNVGTGLSCDGAPIKAIVIDTSVDPTFTSVSTANSACANTDDASVDGTITISVDDNTSPVPATSWTLNWLDDPWTLAGDPKPAQLANQANVPGGSSFTFPTITALRPGDYEVELFNDQANCSVTGFINVPDNPIPPDVLNGDYTILAQDICNPGGSVTINQISISDDAGAPTAGNVADYDFVWYAGADFTTAFAAGALQDATLTNINAPALVAGIAAGQYPTMGTGTYFAVATKRVGTIDKGDGCSTPPIQFIVPNTAEDPTFTSVSTANSACANTDDASVDGTITISVDDNSSPVPATSWTLNWLDDPWTLAGDPKPAQLANQANVPGGSSFTFPTITALRPGDYEVELFNDQANCSVTGFINVPDNPIPPDVLNGDYTILAQDICNPGGSVTINQISISDDAGAPTAGNVADYDFVWYAGADFTTAFAAGALQDATLTNINAPALVAGIAAGQYPTMGTGTYFAVATKRVGTIDKGDGCSTPPIQFIVPNTAEDPTFTSVSTANSACANTDDASVDGTITISVDDNSSPVPATSWTLNWLNDPWTLAGDPKPAQLANQANVPGGSSFTFPTITALRPGDYEVALFNDQASCSVTGFINVPDNPIPPDVLNGDYTILAQDICNPGGSITINQISITDDAGAPTAGNVADYDFQWYFGPDFGTAVPVYGPQQGGAGNDGEILNATTIAVGTMQSGTYWAVATKRVGTVDKGDGCSTPPIQFVVPNTAVDPTFTSVSTPNSACAVTDDASVDGTITISVDDNSSPVPATSWTLNWLDDPWTLAGDPKPAQLANQANVPGGSSFTFPTITALRPGDYEVELFNDQANCSVTGFINVPDNPIPPDVLNGDYTILAQDICNPGGSVTINQISISDDAGAPTAGNVADYDFVWYAGADFTTAFAAGALQDATLTNINAPALVAGIAAGQYPTMGTGTYFAVATKRVGTIDKGDGCSTPPIQFIVPNTAEDPTFTSVSTANSACANTDDASVDGTITISVDDNSSPVPATSWTLNWLNDPWTLAGDPKPAQLANQANVPGGSSFTFPTITALRPGDYEVALFNDQANCSVTGFINVPDNPIPPDVLNGDYTILAQDICNPGGSVTVNQISISDDAGAPTAGNVADYDFQWYFGPDFGTAVPVYGPQQGGAGNDGEILNATTIAVGTMQSGTYWAVATKRVGTVDKGDGCSTPPIQFVVPNTAVDPTFTSVSTPNSACAVTDDASVDGTITISVDDNTSPVPATSWTLNWLNDPWTLAGDPKPAQLANQANVPGGSSFTFPTITALRPGDYEVALFNDQASCSVTGFINVPDNPIPPDVLNGDYTILAQDICNPGGSVTVNQISISDDAGAPTAGNVADYDFQWYFGPDFGTAVPVYGPQQGGAGNDGEILNATTIAVGTMQSGTYWAVATKRVGTVDKGDGCSTPPIQFVVPNTAVDPTFTSVSTPNSACAVTDDASVDGTITISVDDNSSPVPATSWTLNWLDDPWTLAGDPKPAQLANQANVPGGSSFTFPTITALRPGDYEVALFNDQANCSVTGFINVPDNPIPPDVLNGDYTILAQDICNPGGSVTVNQISIINDGGAPAFGAVADYDFNWYAGPDFNTAFTAGVIWSAQGGAGNDGHILNSTTIAVGTMQAGTYWAVATKRNGTVGKGDGCDTPPIQFVVPNTAKDPTLSYIVTANTSCGAAGADGSFTLTPNLNGSPVGLTSWTYTISGPSIIVPVTTPLASTQFAGLLPGQYDITLSHDNAGCTSYYNIDVPTNSVVPKLLEPDIDIVNQLDCNVGGSITVNNVNTVQSISLNTVPDPVLSNYEFIWYVGSDFNTAVQTYTDIGLSGSNGEIYEFGDPGFIGAGTYWVEISKIASNPGEGGLGCISTPYKIIIEDQSIDPVIMFSQTANNACDVTKVNGTLTAVATTNGINVSAGSIFTWYKGNEITDPLFIDGVDGIIDQTIVGEETLRNVAPGIYTVTVLDAGTNCFVEASFQVQDLPSIPDLNLDNAVVVDQNICLPSGSITISGSDILVGGVPLNPGDEFDFIFTWQFGDLDEPVLDSANLGISTGLPIQGPRLDAAVYLAMGAGTYFVSIESKSGIGAGCTGPPIQIIVEDISVVPQIQFSSSVNSSCDLANPNGSITAIASELDGSTDTYSFLWNYSGTGTIPPQADLGAMSTIANAPDGDYSVTVTNTITGCSFTQGQTLILDRSDSEPNIISVVKIDPVNCNPTGYIEVTAVQVGGQPALVSDFEFDWFLNDLSNPYLDPDLLTPARLDDLLPGKYFVIARELNTKCESIAKEIEILADNIIYPEVIIVQDQPQTSCDNLNPVGQLSATVDGGKNEISDPLTYVFTWYEGPVVDPITIINNGNSSTLTGVASGEYTVVVLDNTTGCTSTASYFVEDASEMLRLQISVSSIAVTSCEAVNGSLEARVINHPDLGNFIFTWTGPNNYTNTGAVISNLEPGTYSVVASEITSQLCPSPAVEGIIIDDRMLPTITVVEDNPVTNCDITKLNGQLSASVNGKVGGYDFAWYAGTSASGPVIGVSNRLTKLDVGTYTVEVTDQITNCKATAMGVITDGTVTPPSPTALVLSNVNDCIIPDGAVAASVNNSLLGYLFSWYDGNSTGSSPAVSTPDYSNIDIGDYAVTATDLRTGCISEPVVVNVADNRIYPEFEYSTVPANCETSNGSIELITTGEASIRESIWYDSSTGSVVGNGNLYDSPAGDYEVTVTTFYGCAADGQASIPTEITNYNGISANGDGVNDDFQIDCITLFPNNNVKIFNRSGIKVYEGDHYDNSNIVFRGIGENGLYLIGEDLPDGTYFYIIDKGDGSRPSTGYLELMR